LKKFLLDTNLQIWGKNKNYRGIAIFSTLPKLFEKLVCDKLHETLTLNFHNEQHGFIKNRSINSNLLIYSKLIFDIFEKNNQVDAIYTDFSKAFDSVDHKILIKKTQHFKFFGKFSELDRILSLKANPNG
jgi:Reverse transcriptase (RNA-dependent DNA polymerase)